MPVSWVGSPLLQVAERRAALVALRPLVTVAADLDVEALRQRVDDRDADPVQATGDLVAAAVAELAAGVQDRQHDLDRRAVLLLHHRDRNPGAIVGHGHAVVWMDRDHDAVAAAGKRLVDGVVDDLIHEMVESALAGGADVHARTPAYRVEPLEHGDVLSVVTSFLVSARCGAVVVRQRVLQ